jgi:CBS domain-containing protein
MGMMVYGCNRAKGEPVKRLRVETEIPVARDFMNDHVLSFKGSAELDKAVTKLLRRGFSGAPVVDDDGKVIGILSERDCATVLAEAIWEGWPAGTVADNMSTDVETVGLTADVFAVSERFRKNVHRRLPVVDDEGRLVGLVTRRDLLRALDQFRHLQEQARLTNTYELIEARRKQLG